MSAQAPKRYGDYVDSGGTSSKTTDEGADNMNESNEDSNERDEGSNEINEESDEAELPSIGDLNKKKKKGTVCCPGNVCSTPLPYADLPP
ncbi:hypothetical protein [Absidia glauca]|uniref:Uncharacterized protein n=1 Tax=Absidia glauca TaxID=4829 RepID=A0A168R738_ABSGL|nr:hypothetical protein [Absidia glauca]